MGAFAGLGKALVSSAALGAVSTMGSNLAAGRGLFGSGRKNKAPLRIKQLSEDQKVVNNDYNDDIQVILDGLEREQFGIARDVKNRMVLTYKNNRGNVDLDGSQSTERGQKNPGLEKAASFINLHKSISELNTTIEEMRDKSPELIDGNKEFINNFIKRREEAFTRGFDIKERTINNKLVEMGLNNSSSALGIAMSLASERAVAYTNLEDENRQYAESLKAEKTDALFKEKAMKLEEGKLLLQNSQMQDQKQMGIASLQKDVADSKQQNYLNSRALERGILSDANNQELARHSYSPQQNLGQNVAGQMFGYATQQEKVLEPIRESVGSSVQQLMEVAKNAAGRESSFLGKK